MNAVAIVRQVASEHGYTLADIRNGTRIRRLVAARREAILRLRAAGFSLGRISLVCRKSQSTVEHHVYPKTRERKQAYYRRSRT